MINSTELFALTKGESITITLKSLHTAGYTWKYHMDQKGIIEVIPSGNTSIPTDMPTGGSASYEVFKIKAIQAGSALVKFKQIRAWETDAEPVNVYTANIQVK